MPWRKYHRYLLPGSVINVPPHAVSLNLNRKPSARWLSLHQSRTGGRPGSVMTIRPRHGQSAESLGDYVDQSAFRTVGNASGRNRKEKVDVSMV